MDQGQPSEAVPMWKRVLRVLCAAVLGGVFYSIWMAVFLVTSPENRFLEASWWLLAPIVTAMGFGLGMVMMDRADRRDARSVCKASLWPLGGCAVGAAAVYRFGPMLIVFGMLALGTLSVAAREVVRLRRERR